MSEFQALISESLSGWKMAGQGGFVTVAPGVIESRGGPGLLWYEAQVYEDFVLRVEWRTMRGDANSGVFVRCPPLTNSIQPAIEHGYEIQIDDYGVDTKGQRQFSPLHITGAIYALAPARIVTSRGAALWNEFEITARGARIDVALNGEQVSCLEHGSRQLRGHIALQAHHEGSQVQFRNVLIRVLEKG